MRRIQIDRSQNATRPTKILHVFGQLGRGGAPLRTLELIPYLDPDQYAMHFCTLSDTVGTFADEVEAAGSKIHQLRYGVFGFSRDFARLIRREQYDVVHSHIFYHSGNILRLAAGCGVPVRVAHFRSSHDGRRRTVSRRLQQAVLRRWINRYATDILAVSEESMVAAWRADWQSDGRCRVIYNGLDTQLFLGPSDRQSVLREFALPEDVFLCIHVGRMTAAKNHLRLAEIFAAVAQRRPEAQLLLAGRRDMAIEAVLRRRVCELGLERRVHFCGERDDVPRLLKASDVMVFPSLWEGLPGAVLEACAAGTPVVASNLLSVGEIATRLPGIKAVSLDESDESWAARIVCPLQGRAPVASPRPAESRLRQSVFGMDSCVEAMCSVWDGRGCATSVGG